jgi:hypothetical protein
LQQIVIFVTFCATLDYPPTEGESMGLIAITAAHSGQPVSVVELDYRYEVPCAAIKDDGDPCGARSSYVTLDTQAPVCGNHTEPGRTVAFRHTKALA